MNKLSPLVLALVCLLAPLTLPAPRAWAKLSAREIMAKNEENRKIKETESLATLVTGGGGSPERVKQFRWWRKTTTAGGRFNTLTRFLKPAEIKGEGILFLEKSRDESEVLMYLPAYKKIRRVESQAQSGSFMGSEFSYSDIASPHLEDHEYKLLREEPCPGTENAGKTCSVIEATPASDAVRERTGYSKTVNWIHGGHFMVVKGECYAPDGTLIKKVDASDIREVDPAAHKWMAHRMRIENPKTAKFTDLKFEQVKVGGGIDDSVFTQANLAREK